MFTRLSTMAPKKADQKLETMKPGTRYEASCNMRALITNQKRPKVNSVSGKVMILGMKPMVALTKPMTMGGKNSGPNPSTSNPGTMCATINKLTVLINQ